MEGDVVSVGLTVADMKGYGFRFTYSGAGVLIGMEMADERAVAREESLLPDLLERPGGDTPLAEVTVRALRQVPFGAIDAAARQHIRGTLGAAEVKALGPPVVDDTPRLTAAFTARKPGLPGRPDSYYLKFAVKYVELLGTGAVIRHLAEEFDTSPATMRNLISEARRRGLLTRPPVKGRAEGRLTAKGEALRRSVEP